MTRVLRSVALAAVLILASACSPPPAPMDPPASATPSATPTAASAGWGTLFYYPQSPTTGSAPLVAWRPGDAQTRSLLNLDTYAALYTASISGDGTQIAFAPGGPDSAPKPLVVADVDGRGQRTLLDSVLAECPVTWSPDGRRLAVVRLSGEEAAPGFVDLGTGVFTVGIVEWTCHKAWSGDGRSMATASGGSLWLSAAETSEPVRRVPGLGEQTQGGRRTNDVLSLSRDAGLAAVHVRHEEAPTDPLRRLVQANEIVDTATGKSVPLPVTGQLVQAYFRPDGTAVLRAREGGRYTLVLVSADLQVLARVEEPVALAESVLLGAGTR